MFFFNDTATTEIYTLSLHDALPISAERPSSCSDSARSQRASVSNAAPTPSEAARASRRAASWLSPRSRDRKSTRLNSSHANISYAVFCLKKKIITHLVLPTGQLCLI